MLIIIFLNEKTESLNNLSSIEFVRPPNVDVIHWMRSLDKEPDRTIVPRAGRVIIYFAEIRTRELDFYRILINITRVRCHTTGRPVKSHILILFKSLYNHYAYGIHECGTRTERY